MTLADPTSGAGYGFGQVFSSAHATTIATQLPDAMDGAAGGSYSPSAPVNVAGSGFGTVTIATPTVSGVATFNGATSFTSTVDTTAGTALIGAATMSGACTLTGTITLSGSTASIRKRIDRATFTNADATLTVASDIYIAAATPTVSRTITLKSTSPAPEEGDIIRAVCPTTGGVSLWIFQREDATELGRLGANSRGFLEFAFTNSKWVVVANGGDATITSHTF